MIRLSGCTHCKNVSYDESELNNQTDFCHSCDSKNVNRWLCLSYECGYIGCGQKANDHSNKHYQISKHPIAINVYNHKVYCNICQRQLFRPTVDNSEIDRSNGYIRQVDEQMYNCAEGGSNDERPLGLVGLKNLGNTCYMNAALQCLLNVPQLTEYFDTMHPCFFEDKGHPLSRQYQQLVIEVFDDKRRSCVIPTGVCHTMKALYPPFRGYAQQDSQEFLRVFMDKMHTETRTFHRSSNSSVGGAAESGDDRQTVSKECRSIIHDIFQGRLSTSIKCLHCERISNNEDFFEDLSLPIASASTMASSSHCSRQPQTSNSSRWWHWGKQQQTQQHTPNRHTDRTTRTESILPTANVAMNLLFYQLCWVFSVLVWMKNWFISRTVTLEQCLELFFSQDELKGDNKYSCDKCRGHQNALMQSSLIYTPEVLCLHLKRFKNDFGCSKISTAVRFPIDGLDISPYLHPSNKNEVHLYDLIGVICHYGSGGGGHYTAYVLNWRSQSWFEFDDDQVREVDVNDVMGLTSAAYVLFYKKRDDHMIPIRERADKLLKTTLHDSVFKYYLNRSWVVRFNTFAEPGPINNNEFLCCHGAIQPEKFLFIPKYTIEVSQKTWAYLVNKFGGGPTSTSLLECIHCKKKLGQLTERRNREYATFTKLHQIFENTVNKKNVHILSLRWFRKWEDFVKGIEDELPPAIDNSDVLFFNKSTNQYSLNTNSDYGWISKDTWAFFSEIYSGGPAHNMCPSTPLLAVPSIPPPTTMTSTDNQNGDNVLDSESVMVGNRPPNNESAKVLRCDDE